MPRMHVGALAVAAALLACTDAFTVPAGFSPALLRSRSPQLCPVRSRGSTAEGKFLPALVQPSARRRESSRVGENMVIGVVSVLTGPVVALAALGTLDGLGRVMRNLPRYMELQYNYAKQLLAQLCWNPQPLCTDSPKGGLEAVTDVDKLKQGILDSPEYRYNVLKLFVKYDVDGDGK
ncbi:hypothetical protein T484DRAFT_1760024, partial [Baffinella frigidus]